MRIEKLIRRLTALKQEGSERVAVDLRCWRAPGTREVHGGFRLRWPTISTIAHQAVAALLPKRDDRTRLW